MKHLSALALLVMFCSKATAAPYPTVSHVIQISVDGLAALYLQDYVTNAPAQFPTFVRLTQEGAFTFNARCDYDRSTTVANHCTVVTGRPVLQPEGQPATVHHGCAYYEAPDSSQNIQNSGNLEISYKASVFDVVHDSGGSTAFYASKPKLGFITRGYDDINGAEDPHGRNKIDFTMFTDGYYPPTWITSDQLVDSLIGTLAEEAPWTYTFVHFAEPDYTGHDMHYGGGPWGSPAWSNVVRFVDAQLGRIFTAIESNPVLSNHTALIVTADHGGGGNFDGYSHDDPLPRINYTIPFFVWSPGIPAGADIYSLLSNRADPGEARLDYNYQPQPLRNGDACNMALALLGLPPIPGSSIIPEFRAPSYSVTITRTEQGLAISWPLEAQGYVLEWADAVAANPVWQEVTEGITSNTGVNLLNVVPEPGSLTRFYRLARR